MRILILTVAAIIAIAAPLNAGIDCRSMLSAYLKPFDEDFGLTWAAEATLSAGWFTDRDVRNSLGLVGLDYTFHGGLHTFYFEGGFKAWHTTLEQGEQNGPGSKLNQRPTYDHLGGREFFYKFNGSDTKITAGLQTMTLGDYFLMDERAVGVKYIQNIGPFVLTSNLASVHKNFARQANFCGVRNIYSKIRGKRYDFLGSYLGESNLFAAVLKWVPGSGDDDSEEDAADEFESVDGDEFEEVSGDEFESVDGDEFEEFNEESEDGPGLLKEAGLIFYEEFGEIFHEYKYFYGAMASFNLPWDLGLRFETVYQHIPDDRNIAVFLEGSRNFLWDSGSLTSFALGIFTKTDIDDNSPFYPSFSNLYYGETIRRDAQDTPFAFASVQHHFNWKTKFSLKAQMVTEAKSSTNEIDLIATVKFLEHFKISGIFASMDSELLDETLYMGRIELRSAI